MATSGILLGMLMKAIILVMTSSALIAAPILVGPLAVSGGGQSFTGMDSAFTIHFVASNDVNGLAVFGPCASNWGIHGPFSTVYFSTTTGCSNSPLRLSPSFEGFMNFEIMVGNGGGYAKAFSDTGDVLMEASLVGYVTSSPGVCTQSSPLSVQCSYSYVITPTQPSAISEVPEPSSLLLTSFGLSLLLFGYRRISRSA